MNFDELLLNDFEVCPGEVDSAIHIMQEVAAWCKDTGKNMWQVDALSKDILL